MKYQIREIGKDTYAIDEGFVRCFLLIGERSALLLDTGMNLTFIKEIVQSITDKDVILVNSHCDRDHISCNREFDTVYIHPSETVNYRSLMDHHQEIRFLEEGDRIDLGNREISVFHIPGHTPGSIALLDPVNRFLFTGDSVQSGNNIFMHGPMRDLRSYHYSLMKLEGLKDQYDYCISCHGETKVDPSIVSKLRRSVEEILDGTRKGEIIEFHGKQIQRFDVQYACIDTDL